MRDGFAQRLNAVYQISLVVSGPTLVGHNAAIVVAGCVRPRISVIAGIAVIFVRCEQEAVAEMLVVATVKAITVMIRFATSHPIKIGINGTAKGPAWRPNYAGAIETALRTGHPKAATRTAKTAAACKAAATAKAVTTATAKPAAVTAPAAAPPAAATGKTISDSKSCEENSDRGRSY